jgi:hypothetical protein
MVNCEERRLPVQNSRPGRGGFEIGNMNIIDLQHMSQIYAECGPRRDRDVDVPRMEEERGKPESVPDIGIKFRSTGEIE